MRKFTETNEDPKPLASFSYSGHYTEMNEILDKFSLTYMHLNTKMLKNEHMNKVRHSAG